MWPGRLRQSSALGCSMSDLFVSLLGALFSACNALGMCLWLSRTLLRHHTHRVRTLIDLALDTFSRRVERVRARVDSLERWQQGHIDTDHAKIAARLNRLERETGLDKRQ